MTTPCCRSARVESARSTGGGVVCSGVTGLGVVTPRTLDGPGERIYPRSLQVCANGAQNRARALDRLHRDRPGEGRVDPGRLRRDHPRASGVESSASARIASSRASHDAASRAIHAAVSCSGAELHDVAHLATVPLRGDEAGAVEDGQVLDHRRAAHGQLGGERGRRAVPVLRQEVEDRRRVGSASAVKTSSVTPPRSARSARGRRARASSRRRCPRAGGPAPRRRCAARVQPRSRRRSRACRRPRWRA